MQAFAWRSAACTQQRAAASKSQRRAAPLAARELLTRYKVFKAAAAEPQNIAAAAAAAPAAEPQHAQAAGAAGAAAAAAAAAAACAGAAAAAPAAAEQALLRPTAAKLAGCPTCGSAGRVPCRECYGRGWLTRAGYARRNPLSLPRAHGSKWTALTSTPTLGWRHFTVVQTRRLAGGDVFLLLQADCDASAQLWVNLHTLRNRGAWAAGWLPLGELQAGNTGTAPHGAASARVCRSCNGIGAKRCADCDGTGRAQLILL